MSIIERLARRRRGHCIEVHPWHPAPKEMSMRMVCFYLVLIPFVAGLIVELSAWYAATH